jgi:hypothetical protein
VIPNPKSKLAAAAWENDQAMSDMNVPHWKNWIQCIRTRQKPASDIETCVRSSTACLLANLSMRYRTRLDWNETAWTVDQDAAKPDLAERYRSPWKLEV